ncbi:hypothetical protein E308F_30460 [Moorella sp. E308F]|nr:hypothetical protein E308F_30460 [Moorella sp. E308F]
MKIKLTRLVSAIALLVVLNTSVLFFHDWTPVLALVLTLPILLPLDLPYKIRFVDIYLLYLVSMIYTTLVFQGR